MKSIRISALFLFLLLLCGCHSQEGKQQIPSGDAGMVSATQSVPAAVELAGDESAQPYMQTMDIEEIALRKLSPMHAFIRQAAWFGTVEEFLFSPEKHTYTYTLRTGETVVRLSADCTTRYRGWDYMKMTALSDAKGEDLRRHHEGKTGYLKLETPRDQSPYEQLYYFYEDGALCAIEWCADYAWYRLESDPPLSEYANEGDLLSALLSSASALDAKKTVFPKNIAEDDRALTDARLTRVNPDLTSLAEADNGTVSTNGNSGRCPVFRIDSRQELEAFAARYGEHLENNYFAEGAMQKLCAPYDAAFFETYTLLIVGIRDGSGSHRFAVEHVEIDGERVTVHATGRAEEWEGITADLAGWLLSVPVLKTDTAGCTTVDADLR